jgi:rod shape determining protein RodA
MKTAEWIGRLPWSIVVAVAVLLAFGLAGIARFEELTDGRGFFLRQQIAYSAVAMAVLIFMALPSYRLMGRFSYVFFVLSLISLVAVFFGPSINGVHRWMRLGPASIQPSEPAKLAFVMALARWLMVRKNYRQLRGLFAPLAIALLPVVLILREPDLGTSMVFLPVFFVMLFVAGAKRFDLTCVVLAGVLVTPLLWTQMNQDQRSRVVSLFHQPAPGEQPTSASYQLHQAKRVRAMGGVWGSAATGQLTDDLSAYHLPEAQCDFVFCVVGERFGLPGLAMLLAVFIALIGRIVGVACKTREPFGRLLAAGVAALLAVEVAINTGVNVGLLPVTGISLPLVSYGGSGLVTHAAAIGLAINVALRPGYEMTNEPFRWEKPTDA